jgi:hypothetical protein
MENISTYYDIEHIKAEKLVRLLKPADIFRLLRYIEENMENKPKFLHNPSLKLIDRVCEVLLALPPP